ncbi:MAG: TldD/PmbA family protein [Fidelibacterota bacterium]
MSDINLKDLLSAIDVDADWVGLREVNETATTRLVRDGHPQRNTRNQTHGLMVEVLAEGQFAYSSLNSFDKRQVQEAAVKALEQARKAARYAVFAFTPEARPVNKGSYRSPYQKDSAAISPGELNELLLKANAALKVSDKIVSVTALNILTETKFRYCSSNGSDIEQDFLLLEFDLIAIAQDGTIQQQRSDGGMRGSCRQIGAEFFDQERILARAAQIGSQAVELLTAEECPEGKFDLVLAPDQMMLQIHESVGHALEVDRILGDERNYAGWSFVKLEDFGKLRYGSDLMNILFDPTVSGEFASYGYDDGGLKAEKQYIVKNGMLVRGLGGKESQIRSGVPGVANFRAMSWNRTPIDRMANLNLEPGDSSFEEIIAAVDYGIYMESNRSWSIDDYRNKFQFGCEYGKLIENGKLTQTLKNPNYRGISTPFWRNLARVGNEDTFGIYGTPNCGKGEPNQIIRVGHASPVCLFKNVEIFGGV